MKSEQTNSISGKVINTLIYLFLGLWSIIVVFPMIWVLVSSFKTSKEIFFSPWLPPAKPMWDNFARAWSEANMGLYFFNTMLVLIPAIFFTLLFSAMAGYVIARYEFPGSRAVFFMFTGGMLFPVILALVPLFFLLQSMTLLDTHIGLILVYIAYSLPFTVFFMTGFFKTLPSELMEAAIIDGANHYQLFFKIVIPLAKNGLVSMGIFNFLGQWNQYILPLVLLMIEAFKEQTHIKEQGRKFHFGVPFLFLAGSAFLNWFGAGFLGMVINTPTINYYSHGTYLIMPHGHAALLGAFGYISIAFLYLVVRGNAMAKGLQWDEKWSRIGFWLVTVGVVLYAIPTLVIGFHQAHVAHDFGYWLTRQRETLDAMKPWMWSRMLPDGIMILGALILFLDLMKKAFFLKKTSVGDSVIGYGVLDGFMSREEWLAAGGKPYDEHPWNTVLIFKHLVRFPRPVPVKDLGLDERLRGNRLHGYRIGDGLSDRILELAGYEKVNP